MRLVSVETGLDDVKAHLGNCGYEVIDMADCFRPVEAVIFSSNPGSKGFRNWRGTAVVNSTGKTPREVAELLGERL